MGQFVVPLIYYFAYVQIYFNFYHKNSKISKEIELGFVPSCEFISQDFTQYRVVVICGHRSYLIFISVYPWLLINQNSMQRELNLKIIALNEVSFKQLNIYVKNVDSRKLLPNWIVGICFISLIVIVVLFVPYAFNFCRYSKENKSIPKLLKPSESFKDLLKHETSEGVNHRYSESRKS